MDQINRNLDHSIACPCCGQPVEGAKFLADPNQNLITNGNKTIRLTTQQFKCAKYLIDKFPSAARKEEIYDNVFMQPNGDGPEMKIVDVIICKIRPHLAELGLVIETVWGKGYKLVEADASIALAIRDTSIRMRAPGAYTRWKPEHNKQLLDLMKRKLTVQQCAAVMKFPYMAIERHMKVLQPMLDNSTIA